MLSFYFRVTKRPRIVNQKDVLHNTHIHTHKALHSGMFCDWLRRKTDLANHNNALLQKQRSLKCIIYDLCLFNRKQSLQNLKVRYVFLCCYSSQSIIYTCIYLYVYLFICVFIYMCIYLYVYLFIRVFIYTCIFIMQIDRS